MANATQNPLSPYCEGCEKIFEDKFCSVYLDPMKQMRWVDHPGEGGVGCGFNLPNLINKGIVKERRNGGDRRIRAGQQKQKKKK